MDPWLVFGRIADGVTILAALLAFFGFLSTWLARPRVVVSAHAMSATSAYVYVVNDGGSAPARNFYLGYGLGVDDRGIAHEGGDGPWAPALLPDHSRSITVYDPDEMSFSGDSREEEMRLAVKRPHGFVIDVSWQRPLLPWLRTRRVVLWTPAARASGEPPVVLKGRAAVRAYRTATTAPIDVILGNS